MGKKIGLAFSGTVLIGVFLAWMLFKGTGAVQAWIDPNPLLGFDAWGIAWICVTGGAALLARVVLRREANPAGELD